MSIVVLPTDRHPGGYDEPGDGLGDGDGDGDDELGLGDGEGFGDGEGLGDGDGAGPLDCAGDGFLTVGGATPARVGLPAGLGDCDGLAMVLGEGGPPARGVVAAGFPPCGWLATARAPCGPVTAIRAAMTAATAHTATAATTVAVPTLARILLQPTSVPSRWKPARPMDRARLTSPSPDGEAVPAAGPSGSAADMAAVVSLSSIIRRCYAFFIDHDTLIQERSRARPELVPRVLHSG
jgi:hypothetical protein